MLQEFYINELEERIENEELYGIMNKRINFCGNLNMVEEKYGPGDVCYLVKEVQIKTFLGLAGKKVSKIGSYHYVYGLDTSNIAYISAYISKFIQKLNPTNAKITQSIFCVFDYFLEKDLRILIKFPGGVRKIFYVDDQEATEANPEELRTIYLSSILRSWNIKALKNNELYLEELNNFNSFNYFMESVHLLVKDNSQTQNVAMKSKIISLLESLHKFLMDTRRFNIAILNFSQLSIQDCNLIKYVVEPLRCLKLYEDALSFIASSILKNPSQKFIHLEIDLLTSLTKYQEALEIGKYVTGLHPEISEFWIALAKVYAKQKDFVNCLKTLNNVYILSESTQKSQINSSLNKEFHFQENSVNKNKFLNFSIKYSEILLCDKKVIDMCYTNTQVYSSENSELIYETIKKILNSGFYKFDKIQKKIYYILLDIIKEINYESFFELKNTIFFSNHNSAYEKIQIDSLCSSTERMKGIKQITKKSLTTFDLNKITINPLFETILENLFEDLKIFGLMISENEGYLNMLYNKEDLSIWEIKFCIAIGILAERLKYFNTSLNFYTKAVRHCISKFLYIKIIKINSKIKDYKSGMNTLAILLSYIPASNFKIVNKTPRWIDKIILRILYEHQINEIISWISDPPSHVIDFILKRVIKKYKNWIDVGHHLHLVN